MSMVNQITETLPVTLYENSQLLFPLKSKLSAYEKC